MGTILIIECSHIFYHKETQTPHSALSKNITLWPENLITLIPLQHFNMKCMPLSNISELQLVNTQQLHQRIDVEKRIHC